MRTVLEAFNACVITDENNIVLLPSGLDKQLEDDLLKYLYGLGAVKNTVEAVRGRSVWFHHDNHTSLVHKFSKLRKSPAIAGNPTLADISIKTGAKMAKQEAVVYTLPDNIAGLMIDQGELDKNMKVLVAFAGRGALIDEIRNGVDMPLYFQEQGVLDREYILANFDNITLASESLQALSTSPKYDTIFATPPIGNGRDYSALKRLFLHLDRGGRLIGICSKDFATRTDSDSVDFKHFIADNEAELIDADLYGQIKTNGSTVEAFIIVVNK